MYVELLQNVVVVERIETTTIRGYFETLVKRLTFALCFEFYGLFKSNKKTSKCQNICEGVVAKPYLLRNVDL